MIYSRMMPFVVAAALFMEHVDSTVISTSLPAIAADLDSDPVLLKLAFTSYLLSLAVFIPLSGWTADRFGAKHIFRIAMIVFTLGSIGCGLSTTLWQLIAARAVQGIGGAMMVPVGRLIILSIVPKSDLVRALSYLALPALIGPMIGPPIGGFITTYFHWRWIFLINVPFCLLALALATAYVPTLDVRERRPLDVTGVLLTGFGLSSLVFGATIISSRVLPLSIVLALVVMGMALLTLYVFHARRTPHPVLDLSLLSIPTFHANIVGGFLFRVGTGAVPFLLPLMLQLSFGLTAFQSGALTFAGAAGALVMKTTAGPILHRFGFKRVLVVNALISAFFLALTAAFTPETPHALIIAVLLMAGFFRSLQFTSLQAIAYAVVPEGKMSNATSFVSVAQQLSVSAGVAVAAMVLEILREARGHLQLALSDFSTAFLVIACISAACSLLHLRLPAGAGSELIRRRKDGA
ncbi:MAG: DHA2 family efflux MFS transporter permease subunit [Hyphomicrobiaceae bacterium]|nr:MAG: DHA2 family efflux MFS transporter permease subunit [Hyphomicrobiaceae bacterium]